MRRARSTPPTARARRPRHDNDSDADMLHNSDDDDDDHVTATTTTTTTTTTAPATTRVAATTTAATAAATTTTRGAAATRTVAARLPLYGKQYKTTRATTAAAAATNNTSHNSNKYNNNNNNNGSSGNSVSASKKTLLPQFLYMHGRTVYGGNPIVQQTLPGYFAYASPFVMVPLLFVLMVPFVVVGASILVKSTSRHTVTLSYSDIHRYQYTPDDPAVNVNDGVSAFVVDGVTHRQGTVTWVTFNVTEHMRAPVYMYYTIDNMYQNYRAFHAGRSATQLRGVPYRGPTRECEPYDTPGYVDGSGDHVYVNYTVPSHDGGAGTRVSRRASSFYYYPCGIAPWAMFNDTFVLYRVVDERAHNDSSSSSSSSDDGGSDYNRNSSSSPPSQRLLLVCNSTDFDAQGTPLHGSRAPNQCSKASISWPADTRKRFRPLVPDALWWSRRFPYPTSNAYLNAGWYLNEPGHAVPDPQDLDLQVWLRSAPTSSFRKLHRVLDTALPPGTYALRVTEYYDVVSFRGRKGVVLRGKSWVNDSDTPLGVLFAAMGCACFVLGVSFLVEYALQRCAGARRGARLPLPRRRWFCFDPDGVEFARYYQLRMRRHRVTAELQRAQEVERAYYGAANDAMDSANNNDDAAVVAALAATSAAADDDAAMLQRNDAAMLAAHNGSVLAAHSDVSSL